LPRTSQFFNGRKKSYGFENILLDRVCRGLKSINPLTKGGFKENKAAFSTLVHYITGLAGLEGGKDMAEAAVLWAKTLMGEEDEDLSIDQTIKNLMNFFQTERSSWVFYWIYARQS
jgi:hypothetical protein